MRRASLDVSFTGLAQLEIADRAQLAIARIVQQRTVQTGQLEGRLRVIASGIAPDDLVVISGNQKAIPGEKVAPQVTAITADAAPAPPGKS